MTSMFDAYPVGSTKAQIRRVALAAAVFFGCFVMADGLFHGQGFRKAARNGAVASVGGMAAWTVYHLVSGCNNGIITFAFCTPISIRSGRDDSLPSILRGYLVLMIVMAFIGLTGRVSVRKKRHPRPADALFDPELDEPAPSPTAG